MFHCVLKEWDISKAKKQSFAGKSTKEAMPRYNGNNGESRILGHLTIRLERSGT
jgi:hypothetical protein